MKAMNVPTNVLGTKWRKLRDKLDDNDEVQKKEVVNFELARLAVF